MFFCAVESGNPNEVQTKFLEPTSNRIERFFSAAGYSLGDLRQSITPLHLEEQLFLKANARMWNVETVNDALQEEN